jgi:serine/threonine-protein kinase
MALTSGTRFGPHEIVAPIGAGGMGEVYRAKDTNLDRDVAIKVLPESFALDADRVARFTREAKTLAALNHPNIAAIYGLEKTPDLTALVMELVEGEDLSAHLARGPIPLAEALPLARQVADALEAAHEQGIIHRDLKPQNIKVRADGTVKVLDFGLAKALGPEGASAAADAMHSPTLTNRATQMGMIIGTAAYMAPEQAKGRAADKRADIWAFGVVLYEMLSGTRAFKGEEVPDVLAAVLRQDIDLAALPPDTPTPVRRLIARCLDRDLKTRLRDIGEARIEIARTEAGAQDGVVTTILAAPAPARSRWSRALPLAVTALAAFLVAGLAAWRLWPTAAPLPVSRFSHVLAEGLAFRGGALAVSPDGRAFTYLTNKGLYLRKLGELEAHMIPGLENETLYATLISPDGQHVAIFTSNQLKRISIEGSTPVVIGPFQIGGGLSGGSWGSDDTIMFGQAQGIMRVPTGGGTPELLIPAKDGERLGYPSLLPDRDTVLFAARPADVESSTGRRIVAQRISTGQRTVLVEGGTDPRYLPTGHLVYAVDNALMGIAFDRRRLTVNGRAAPLVQAVRRSGSAASYGVGDDGTLVFAHGANAATSDQYLLALSDRAGAVTALAVPAGTYSLPRVSPDGRRLAVEVAGPADTYIAIYDLDGRTALRRLTFGGGNRYPVWSRDGQRVTFQSDREGDRAIFWQRADGAGPAERLTKPEKDTAHVPASWSPKDEALLFSVVPVKSEQLGALFTYARAGGRVVPFGGVASATLGPVFSPDGRWVAYASGGGLAADGTRRIYIQPFPATGAKYEVPVPPGATLMSHPFWAPDGAALYFSTVSGRFGVVPVTTHPTIAFGNPSDVPRRFSSLAPWAPRGSEITPDGRFVGRIAVGDAPGAEGTGQLQEIHIVLNWVEELKRLVPVK